MENFQIISEKLINFIAQNPELDSVFVEYFHKKLSSAAVSFEHLTIDNATIRVTTPQISKFKLTKDFDIY